MEKEKIGTESVELTETCDLSKNEKEGEKCSEDLIRKVVLDVLKEREEEDKKAQ